MTATGTEQAETITRLNRLTTLDWTVDAGPLPLAARERCSEDTAHGWGTCYSRDLDGACPDCAAAYCESTLVAGAHLAIDVLQEPTDRS